MHKTQSYEENKIQSSFNHSLLLNIGWLTVFDFETKIEQIIKESQTLFSYSSPQSNNEEYYQKFQKGSAFCIQNLKNCWKEGV